MKMETTDAGWAAHKLIEALEKRADDDALEELQGIGLNTLESLQRLAVAGNKTAAIATYNVLIKSLDQFCETQKQMTFADLARNTMRWPGFLTVDNDLLIYNGKLIQHLQLGADVPIKPRSSKGRQWTRETPTTHIALRLILGIQKVNRALPPQKKLPPFNARTKSKWWEAARVIFYRIYGKNFEAHPDLRNLYPAMPGKKAAGNTKAAGNKGLELQTWRRDQITTKVQQSFFTILREVPA